MRRSGDRAAILFIFALGLIVGVFGGLVYAWALNPVEFVNIAPDRLVEADQELFVLLIGEAYLVDRDLNRAWERLQGLGGGDLAERVSVLAERAYLRGEDFAKVQALTVLAQALGKTPRSAEVVPDVLPTLYTPPIPTSLPTVPSEALTPASLAPTRTPLPVVPTATPTPVRFSQYHLIALETSCENDQAPLIEVYVFGEGDEGIPGIAVVVESNQRESDRFFTGLKPAISLGYADFLMEPDRVYTLTLEGLGEPVVGLTSAACQTPDGGLSLPSYELVFRPLVIDAPPDEP
jgi:hypothetical protein